MPQIRITVGGALVRLRPETAKGNSFDLQIQDTNTVHDCLLALGGDGDMRVLAILNGNVVAKEDFHKTLLSDKDELSLMPPIQAG